MGCFPFLASDAVDRQLKEAENLKARDRQRINKEIEKGKLLYFSDFFFVNFFNIWEFWGTPRLIYDFNTYSL